MENSLKSMKLVDDLVDSIMKKGRIDHVPPNSVICMILDQIQNKYPEAFEFLEKKYKNT